MMSRIFVKSTIRFHIKKITKFLTSQGNEAIFANAQSLNKLNQAIATSGLPDRTIYLVVTSQMQFWAQTIAKLGKHDVENGITPSSNILRAFAYDVSKELSIFIGLIITNCIVMGRLEAFALGNGVWKSFLDGIGNAAGYGFILIVVAFFRELLGSGKLLGIQVIPDAIYEMGYVNNGLMLLSPMALITVGIFIWLQRSRNRDLIEKN